ncbi:hypothetical protein BWQ96_06529 [Gracilariopsis chorda]|uniref:Nucleoporin Nup159/Nup146 N-terminal domain-containing protein n=1 Tax=Gracilariopsis chorda TaxID=448386 RepID=A0A2V3INR9_9FLOR|nr:hypothetical protein BWQ96_06529 [Gracilariopsis chorda]|eukprot:PXF43699.1 hypothetical protein BWQ96_06529 [Gracilariopsis chorda]
MDDLGPPSEASPEFFSCTARAPISLTKSHVSENCASLLACTSRFGYAVVAHGSTLSILKLGDIQHGNSQAIDVDLSGQNVNVIMSLQFVMGDTVLLVHAECEVPVVLLFHLSALVNGEMRKLSAPSGAITYAAYSEPNPSSTPPSQLIATLTSKVYIYNVSMSSCEKIAKVDVPGPLSLALSPSNKLIAIGTQRGCVSIHFTSNGSMATTIVEVESGWIPFAVHFVKEDAVLVSYSRDNMTSYVMWTLVVGGNSVSIGPRFPFGELCLPSPDVGSEEDPTVIFNVIPSWEMCMISSSVSTEAEIIAKVDSEWQCWKLDESKSVYLPTNDEGEDTPPLGSALDFTDTNLIEPEDASSNMIQPMPRYLVLTSEFKILPYSLIDERPKAKCDHIRSPIALPPVTATTPVDPATFPNFSTRRRSSAELSHEDTYSSTTETLAVSESTEGNRATYMETPLSSNTSDLFGASPMTNLFPTPFRHSGETDKLLKELQKQEPVLATEKSPRESFSDTNAEVSPSTSIHTAKKPPSPPVKTTPLTSLLPEPPNRSSGEMRTQSLVEGISKTSTKDKTAAISYKDSLESLPPRKEFSGTEEFLSHFSRQEQPETKPESVFTPTAQENGEEMPKTCSAHRVGNQEPYRETKKVSLQPSLEQAINTASTGDGRDLIKSMLLEMSEELATNRQAGEVMTNELISQSQVILSQIESARGNLQKLFHHTRVRFRAEAALREEVTDTLEHILRISRAYESLSLELEVENATGFCRELKPEDKAVDEQIATKESDIVNSLISIEERLADESASKRHQKTKEVVREIFSSLSLQGIRIRRVHELLRSLSQRLEEHDRGGRQSSLGLSLARLEQLRIDDRKSPEQAKGSREGKPKTRETYVSEGIGPGVSRSSSIPADSHEIFPATISRLLRKLAMRGGREHISPDDQDAKTIPQTNVREEQPCVNESLKNEIRPNHNKLTNSQMDEVRGLLNSKRRSSETEQGGYSQTNAFNFKMEKPSKLAFEERPLVIDSIQSNSSLPQKTIPRSGLIQQNKSRGTILPQPLPSQVKLPSGSTQGQKRFDEASSKPPPRSYEEKSDVSISRGQLAMKGSDAMNAFSFLNLSENPPTVGEVDRLTPTQTGRSSTSTNNKRSSDFVSMPTHQQGTVTSLSVTTASIAKPPLPKIRSEKPTTKQTGHEEVVTPSASRVTPAPIAKLPPDDFLTPAKKTNESKIPFASLPPDEFSSGTDSLRKPDIPFAGLPPDGEETDESQTTESEDHDATAQPHVGDSAVSQSSLPDKGKPFGQEPAAEVSKAETPLVTPATPQEGSRQRAIPAFGSSQPGLFSSLKTDASQPPGTNAESLFPQSFASSSTTSATPSLFGQKSTFPPNTSGVFGMNGLAQAAAEPFSSTAFDIQQSSSSQAGTNMFQAAIQMNRSDNNTGGGGALVTASDSEDSDDENPRQGMDTSMGSSSAFSGSQTTSFGFGSQSASGGSLFGQAFSTAFQSPVSGGGQFGQSPVQSGSGFGGSNAFQATPNSFGSPTPSGTGSGFGSGAAFGMASRIGGTPGFGETSAIGMTPSFGSASPVGAQGSPFAMPGARFGDSSFGNQGGQTSAMLGFGSSAGALGSSSPFGALSGGAGFGGSAGSQSGFAALAGNSGGLVFGNGSGPPAFTSAAFTQRRA